jgi:hypothetical protein
VARTRTAVSALAAAQHYKFAASDRREHQLHPHSGRSPVFLYCVDDGCGFVLEAIVGRFLNYYPQERQISKKSIDCFQGMLLLHLQLAFIAFGPRTHLQR